MPKRAWSYYADDEALDVCRGMLERERERPPISADADYFQFRPVRSAAMICVPVARRAAATTLSLGRCALQIIIDWMCEVAEEFKLCIYTTHISVRPAVPAYLAARRSKVVTPESGSRIQTAEFSCSCGE